MKRRLVALVTVLLALFSVAAKCPAEDKVVVKAGVCSSAECWIVHGKSGEKGTLERVNQQIFRKCKVDYQWPECGDGISRGMRVIQLDNDPYRSTKREKDEQNARTVCVASISDPEVKITNSWFIGSKQLKEEAPKIQGIFQRCELASPGTVAYIKAEHHAEPSTLLCHVWVYKNGQRWPIDFVITQALGDCVARAEVPPV